MGAMLTTRADSFSTPRLDRFQSAPVDSVLALNLLILVNLTAAVREAVSRSAIAEYKRNGRFPRLKRVMRRAPKSIGFQLLLAVNSVCAVLIALFLGYDYNRQLDERIGEKRGDLSEEARTLLPAVLRIQHHGTTALQEFLDEVCGSMRENESPGHHLAVRFPTGILQAQSHHRASLKFFAAMEAAAQPSDGDKFPNRPQLIVGTHSGNGVTVYVSERADDIRRAVRGDALRRLAEMVLLAAVAAVIVNIVLLRIVVRPFNRLAAAVHEIASGRLGVQTAGFKSSELAQFADALNNMSVSLATADRQRVQQMEKARRIQKQLLPTNSNVPGVRIAQLYQPAEDVAGDYFDILPLPDESWLFCMADVCGHGVPAAMTAAMLKAFLVQATEQITAPCEIVEYVNRRFLASTVTEDFATMLVARICSQTGKLEYASAGHVSGLLLEKCGAITELRSTGMLIGVMPEAGCSTKTVSVAQGTRLLLLTDGVIETFNSRSECFGRERLSRLFADCGALPVDETVTRIDSALIEFRGGEPSTDDVSLMLLEFLTH